MADSLARLVVTLEAQTASYQKGLENANKQLEGFGRTQRALLGTVEGNFQKFSRGINSLLAGGGILIGFRAITRELEEVAKKFSATDVAARDFLKSQELLSKTFENLWRSGLNLLGPALKALADFMDPAALATKGLANATEDLAKAEEKLAKARREAGHRSGLNAPNFAAMEKEVRDAKSMVVAREASLRAITREKKIQDGLDLALRGDEFTGKYNNTKDMSEAKARADATAKYNEDLVASRIKLEEDAQKEINEYNARTVEEYLKNQEKGFEEAAKKQADEERDLSDYLSRIQQDRQTRMNDQAEAFGERFADNLMLAADYGFDAVLESWARTLEQMVLKSAAADIFKALFSKAPAGSFMASLGSIFGGGKAAGGPVLAGVPYMVGEQGPELFVPRSSGNIVANGAGGNVVVNQTIDARGSQNPSQLIAAMTVAKNQAIVEIQNARRRGR